MRIAISTDGANVSAHFGRCPSFTIVDIKEGNVISKEVIDNPGHKSGFLPEFLHENSVDCIVAGGMGNRAAVLFDEKGIKSIVGVSGTIEEVIKKLSGGNLEGSRSLCSPGAGKGYGVPREDKEHK